jgi:hypothetical protein
MQLSPAAASLAATALSYRSSRTCSTASAGSSPKATLRRSLTGLVQQARQRGCLTQRLRLLVLQQPLPRGSGTISKACNQGAKQGKLQGTSHAH